MDPPDKQGNDIVKIEEQGRGPHSYPPRFEGYRMHGSEPVKGLGAAAPLLPLPRRVRRKAVRPATVITDSLPCIRSLRGGEEDTQRHRPSGHTS